MRKDFPLSAGGLSALSGDIGVFPGVAERLLQARKQAGTTQREMAEHLGISLNTYLRTESGRRALDVNELARLAELGVDIGWLLTGMSGFAAPVQTAFAQLDGELMGRIVDGLVKLYAEENRHLAPADQGRVSAKIYGVLAAIEDAAERRGALRYALENHRQELGRADRDADFSKHRA